MSSELTKTQIDRLGDRLRKGNIEEADLRLLDLYRRSFTDAYEIVVGTIRKDLMLEPTGRPSKTTTSISDKLRRESIRLTQIQDIAGCRLTVQDIATQDKVVQSLANIFEQTTVVDRRERPSHGYRAVHVIVNCQGKVIEVQVRTSLQHTWAELSEKLSDVEPSIKYGGGNETARTFLIDTSSGIAEWEGFETELSDMQALMSSQGKITDDDKRRIFDMQEMLSSSKQRIYKFLRETIEIVEEHGKGENDAFSD